MCRSREGAWIEISKIFPFLTLKICRSREGAWIEISSFLSTEWTYLGRSREGAWIEIRNEIGRICRKLDVAPVRERGLKSHAYASAG